MDRLCRGWLLIDAFDDLDEALVDGAVFLRPKHRDLAGPLAGVSGGDLSPSRRWTLSSVRFNRSSER